MEEDHEQGRIIPCLYGYENTVWNDSLIATIHQISLQMSIVGKLPSNTRGRDLTGAYIHSKNGSKTTG